LEGLPGAERVASLDVGGFVAVETALRLSCDARLETVAHDGSGKTIGIDRASRNVPFWLRRQVINRDQHCAFPACSMSQFLFCHHREHWARGGKTNLDNLDLLCFRHHELVHEGGWSYRREPDGSTIWFKPDGTVFDPRARTRHGRALADTS
jgi:hypothetical protein